MADLFELSMRISNLISTIDGDTLPVRLILCKDKWWKINTNMEQLLYELETVCEKEGTVRKREALGYLYNYKKDLKITFDHLRSDLEYYSDRWCYERFYAIRYLWKKLKKKHGKN